MPRLHLFEFEDQDWFPAAWRDYGTDFLQFLTGRTQAFRPVLPLLEKALKACGTARIVDLASGGGGGWLGLGEELTKKFPGLRITLTDAFPNLPAFRSGGGAPLHRLYGNPRQRPAGAGLSLSDVRTLFLSFHHFRPRRSAAHPAGCPGFRQPGGRFRGTGAEPAEPAGHVFLPPHGAPGHPLHPALPAGAHFFHLPAAGGAAVRVVGRAGLRPPHLLRG
jgi:hypothetical protein